MVNSLRSGDFFGEAALISNNKRAATVTAQGDCVMLCLDRDSFIKIFGNKLNQFVKRNAITAEVMRPADFRQQVRACLLCVRVPVCLPACL